MNQEHERRLDIRLYLLVGIFCWLVPVLSLVVPGS